MENSRGPFGLNVPEEDVTPVPANSTPIAPLPVSGSYLINCQAYISSNGLVLDSRLRVIDV